MNSNQGFSLKKKGVGKRENAQDTGSILKLAPNDKWATQKSKPQQQAKVKATKSGVNKSKVNRRSSEKRNVKQQSRSAVHDEDEPDISEGNESYLEESFAEETSDVLKSSTTVTKSLQTPKSYIESGEDSEEDETQPCDFKLQLFESTSACEASTKDSHCSDASDSTEQDEEKEDSEDKFVFVFRHFEMPYTFGINTTPGFEEHNQKRQDRRLHRPDTEERESHVKYSASRNDSGIGETPLAGHLKRQAKISKKMPRKQLPLQIYSSTPITPRAEQSEPMEQDVEYSADSESDEESLQSHGSQQQIVDRRQFVQWSRSGPSNVSGSPVSGTLRSEHSEGCHKEPLYVSEDSVQSYRDQHICKPRKLSYEDKPYNQEKPEEEMSDEEVIRREVQGLINQAGSKTLQAVRRKHRMIRSFFQRTSDMMLSSIDTFRDETQTISYGALEKYKRQFSEQVQGLRKQMEKTTLIVDGLEKQFKILKSQRQVEEKRFKSLQHLQGLMETEVTKLEQRRNEQEATLRTEMEKEMLKLQKKFLQETRKQTEDHVKLAFNTLLFP